MPGDLEIGPAGIHLWRFLLADSGFANPRENLTTDERSRADAMTSPIARQSFVAGQSALRAILSAYTRTHPRDVEMERGPHGKPMLRDPSANVHFNVSHSGLWGVVAVARFAVGVDVEQIRLRRATAALAHRFMTEGERDLLRKREERHGAAAFFVLWSRKEAYLKATGFGLAAPFSLVDSSAQRLPDIDERGRQLAGETPWIVEEFFVDEQHPGAIVARAGTVALSFRTLRAPDR